MTRRTFSVQDRPRQQKASQACPAESEKPSRNKCHFDDSRSPGKIATCECHISHPACVKTLQMHGHMQSWTSLNNLCSVFLNKG